MDRLSVYVPYRLKIALCAIIFLAFAACLPAQTHNSVPLDHAAYRLIEMGVLKGVIPSPPSGKPWSEFIIKDYLREMLVASGKAKLSQKEIDIVSGVLDSFDRKSILEQLLERKPRDENSPNGETSTGEAVTMNVR